MSIHEHQETGYMPFGEFVQWLEAIENAINVRFEERTGRKAEFSDKCKKLFEEVGELIKAPTKEECLREACDVIVTAFSMAFKKGFTTEEILKGFAFTIDKLNKRWFEGQAGKHDI